MSWEPVMDVGQVSPVNIPPEVLLPGLKFGISVCRGEKLLPLGAAHVPQRHEGRWKQLCLQELLGGFNEHLGPSHT